MEYFLNNHPCKIVAFIVVVAIAIQVLGTFTGASALPLIGTVLFVLAMITGIVGLLLRRSARKRVVAYCNQCGKPFTSESELNTHAVTHNLGLKM